MMKIKKIIAVLIGFLLALPLALSYTEGQPYDDLNATSLARLVGYSNSVTSNWMGVLFMLACTVVMIIIFEKSSNVSGMKLSDSLSLSFFMTLVLFSYFWVQGFIAGKFMVLWLALAIMSQILKFFDM